MDPFAITGLALGAAGSGLAALQAYYAKKQLVLQRQQTPSPAQSIPSIQPAPEAQLFPPSSGKENLRRAEWQEILRFILQSVIPAQLRSINVFDTNYLTIGIERLQTNSSFSCRIRTASPFDSALGQRLFPSQWLGLLEEKHKKELCDANHPITVAIPVIFPATHAIFFYLKQHYAIELLYKFPHALEIVSRIEKGDCRTDACVVGDAPGLRLLNKEKATNYEFFMLMPQTEQRIVAPRLTGYQYGTSAISEGTYCFISDTVSTQLFQSEQFELKGIINKQRVRQENREPHEAVTILRSGDPERRIILWTPHWQILSLLGIADILGDIDETTYLFDCLLFLRRSFLRQRNGRRAEALLAAIRHAWSKLLFDQACLDDTIEKMLLDADYVETLIRVCGLHQLGADYNFG